MALTCVYLLNGAVLHRYYSCRVLTFNYYGLLSEAPANEM